MSPCARPVVLDVDTGVDDALALLLAALHPDLDLQAVTCVGGNVSVDAVVANTLLVLQTAGRSDVPVARGAARPLLEPESDARHVHGEDGMGDLAWPPAVQSADPRHGVELLRDVLLQAARGPAEERITLVTLAPLTNIALLLRTYPEVAAGLHEMVVMGGAAQSGNATASAEFNVWHDPEAAAIVLEAAGELAIPTLMYGLDVFYDVRVSLEQAQALTSRGDPRGAVRQGGPVRQGGHGRTDLAGALIAFQCKRFGSASATIGDAGAVCAVIAREGLHARRLPVRVELAGSYSRGRTIVDRRDWSGDLSHDPHGLPSTAVDVALGVDGAAYARLWLDTVAGTDQ